MSNIAVINTDTALDVPELRTRINRMQEVLNSVMKENVHYGKIPGTPKPSLWKPGAEAIMATFQLTADPVVEDLSTEFAVAYRVKVNINTAAGNFVGAGIGECSSLEEKYCWRRAICDEEYEATDPINKRVKWSKGKGGSAYSQNQVRTNPADVANTILKMAKKRALIDAVLTATAASDIFAQDIEDVDVVATFISTEKQQKLKDALAALFLEEAQTLFAFGLESFADIQEKDLADYQQRIVKLGQVFVINRIQDAGTIADLEELAPAMKYYPSGTQVRDVYRQRMTALANEPSE